MSNETLTSWESAWLDENDAILEEAGMYYGEDADPLEQLLSEMGY